MSKTRDRIRDSQLRYKQGLGQNFLYDDDLLAELVRLSGVTKDDDVLEIGPGSGTMTRHLCGAANRVLSLELDERLIPLLTAYLHDCPNFEVRQGDALTEDLPALTAHLHRPLSVVANIPYYITTPLIQLLLGGCLEVKQLSLMVQKEVADKIMAQPGEDSYGMLAVRCQYFCDPYVAMDVPAQCFTPVPKVDSAFVILPLRKTPPVTVTSEKTFFRVAAAAFVMRRKTMVNNLCPAFSLTREDAVALVLGCGLDERVRGEKLTLEDFAALANAIDARA